MRLRKGPVRIVVSGAVALVLSVAAVWLVTDSIILSDVREEMALTLDEFGATLNRNSEFLEKYIYGVAGRSRDEFRLDMLKDLCWHWPTTIEGYLFSFRLDDGEVLASGSRKARRGERLADVVRDGEAMRKAPAKEVFRACVYGDECLCEAADFDGYRVVAVVPLKALNQYLTFPLISVGAVLLVLVTAFTLVALKLSSLLLRLRAYIEGEKNRMKEDLKAACLVQTAALPPPFPAQHAFSVKARMDPAKVVGGDFYDYQMLTNGLMYFLVADVSGKGISAAMFMMRAKSVIKQCLAETGDLAKGMTNANAILAGNNESRLFVTVWVGILNPRTGRVRYVNAGHNPPLIRRKREGGDDLEWVKCKPSLVMALMPGIEYPIHELTLAPGDSLFLYTDGVTEAQNAAGKFYGEKRLEKVIAASGDDCIAKVRADLDVFQGVAEPSDDVTMVAIDYFGTPPGTARGFLCNREVGFVEAVKFVEEELERVSCPPDIRKKFLLAFDEVGSNVVSYSGAEYFTIKVAVEATPPAITITVTDAGKAFNPLDKAAPDLGLSFEQRVTGGFGIFITRQLMDEVIYCRDEGRNVLTLRKLCDAALAANEKQQEVK